MTGRSKMGTHRGENGLSGVKEQIKAIQDQQMLNRESIAENEKIRREAIAELWNRLDDVQRSLNKIGRPDWMVILSAIGTLIVLFGIIGYFTIQPIEKDIRDESKRLRHFETEVKTEFVRKELYQSERDAFRKEIDVLHRQVNDMRAQYATREQLTAIATRVDNNSRVVGGLFPLDKVIDNLQRRVDALQQGTTVVTTPPSPSPAR